MKTAKRQLVLLLFLTGLLAPSITAQQPSIEARLQGFDAYLAQVLKDWNVPGIGVGVVVKDKLVLAKGYGYRDYGKKIPYTPTTTQPIASNTKLFTAVAAGLLVEEGKLDWDKPIRQFVPSIQFYNDELNRTVTIRDMLSHRSGITRHDLIWYKSDFTQKELFERLKYLEPSENARSVFLYNNMMYSGAGYAIELLSGKPWEQFVRDRILTPLGMSQTTFTIEEMVKGPEPGVPFTERRDNTELYAIPYYSDAIGVAPAGAINSSIVDMSKWLIALLNEGKLEGKQVIPRNVIKQTLAPSIALPNTGLEVRGWREIINAYYGMGRWSASYRGHLLAYHGGDLPGFHSQVSLMPYDSIGVLVFVIGNHAAPLYNIVSYNVYERLLGLSLTPWSERQNTIRLKNKEADKTARTKAGAGRVANTRPSHPLGDYLGEFEHPAYGVLTISQGDTSLMFDFHKIKLPLSHFHYDRFDTPDDEQNGKWSVNFLTNPQGEIDKAELSLDEAAVHFTRRVPAALSSAATLNQYLGTYETANGGKFDVVLRPDGTLAIQYASGTFQNLIPWQPRRFRIKEFPDVVFEFVLANGRVTELRQTDPGGEYKFVRRER
ncbi:MAG TPA: serine hydrolase [Gemmatimonadales bacterium]|jgi:CubicO group peptidase (beta-lactamase class C family)|nr:serine hydrolase [Gemmatimonadales bacterium]